MIEARGLSITVGMVIGMVVIEFLRAPRLNCR
jgi:hypothetical protein